jgi:hypothetical protein
MVSFDQRNQQVETQYNAGRDIHVHAACAPPPSLSREDRRNRSRLLARVRAEVDKRRDDVLEGSTTLVALRMERRPEAVQHSSDAAGTSDWTEREAPDDVPSITAIFDARTRPC